MTETYRVRIQKDYLVFSAGHFITYDNDVCERLHGHNYRVGAEIRGPLDENCYVVDFIALRDTLKEIVDELDHHMLLPTRHSLIAVSENGDEVEVRFRDRRWVFPHGDCVLLPIENTTAELLARFIAMKLLHRLKPRTDAKIEWIGVDVDECFGQVGTFELEVG